MGKKYIIEIPDDKIGDFVGSTHFLMPYMMAGHIGHHDTGLPIEPYTEPDLEQVRKAAYEKGFDAGRVLNNGKYEKGINDAWEAARKIAMAEIYGGFSWESMNNMFGTDSPSKIYKTFTASEAIEKIRQYEQEKEEFHVGDEFEIETGQKFVIIKMDGNKIDRYIDENGTSYCLYYKYNTMRKTGRHFPEIAEVLAKMKEAEC